MTSRAWCFTINGQRIHDVAEEIHKTFQRAVECKELRYAIFQLEYGEETKRIHIQGYAEFPRPIRRSGALRIIGRGAHVERRRGTRAQARDYCRKRQGHVAGPYEFGSWEAGGQGKRTDGRAVLDRIKAGANLRDLLDFKPGYFIRYTNGIKTAIGLQGGPNRDGVTCTVLIGPTGTGKSHRAFQELPEAYVWDGGKWWDNYDGQRDVIVDDFCDETDRKRMVPLNELLKILDKYRYQCQVKGGYVWLKATRFIITSNVEVDNWYPGASSIRIAALKRRLTVERMMEPYVPEDDNEEPIGTLDPEMSAP